MKSFKRNGMKLVPVSYSFYPRKRKIFDLLFELFDIKNENQLMEVFVTRKDISYKKQQIKKKETLRMRMMSIIGGGGDREGGLLIGFPGINTHNSFGTWSRASLVAML